MIFVFTLLFCFISFLMFYLFWNTLGVAGGSTGVDQSGTLVDGDPPQPGLKRSLVQAVSSVENVLKALFFTVITQVIDSDFYPPTEDARSVGNASVLHNFPQVRKIALETPDLVQLLLILND